MDNNKNEIWKDIDGYDGMYKISNIGRVKSLVKWNNKFFESERILKQSDNKNGYLVVTLTKCGVHRNEMIHRLVAKAFVENPNNKKQVNHIDGCKRNNVASNLEWVTPSENSKHAYRLGLRKYNDNEAFKKKKPVQQILDGNIVAEYESLNDAQRKTGILYQGINECCKGKLKTSGGYYWRYKE